MKQLLLLLVMAVFTRPAAGQSTWQKTYTLNLWDTPKTLYQAANSDLLVGGYFFETNSSTSRHLFLLRVSNVSGDTISDYTCESGLFCEDRLWIDHLAQNPQGNLVTCGESTLYPCPYLARIEDNLDIVWQRFLCPDTIHYVSSFKAVADGFLLVGTYSLNEYVLQKRDFDGQTIWTKRIIVNEVGQEPQMALSADGGVVMIYRAGLNNGTQYLVKFDAGGTQLWQKTLTGHYTWSMCPSADDGTLTVESTDAQDTLFRIKKFASHGTVLWDQPFKFQDFVPLFIGSDALGNIYTAGRRYISGPPFRTNFGLAKFDASGNNLWKRYYERGTDDNCFGMVQTNDSGVCLMGTTRDTGTVFTHVLLIKADVNGNVSNSTTPSEAASVAIRPNPARDYLSIRLDRPDAVAAAYRVWSPDGLAMAAGELRGVETRVEISDWPPGFYFLRIQQDSGATACFRVVKL